VKTPARDKLPPQWREPQGAEQHIYTQAYVGKHCVRIGARSSSDCINDTMLMEQVLEFKYAATRQNRVLVVDFVPKWKAWILKHVLKVVVVR